MEQKDGLFVSEGRRRGIKIKVEKDKEGKGELWRVGLCFRVLWVKKKEREKERGY